MSTLVAGGNGERRKLWDELADALEQAQRSLLERNLPRFEEHTERQRHCCARLAAMGEAPDPALANVQARVRRLSRVQAALLRRALQSVLILRNLAGSSRYQVFAGTVPESFRQEA